MASIIVTGVFLLLVVILWQILLYILAVRKHYIIALVISLFVIEIVNIKDSKPATPDETTKQVKC